MRNHVIPRSLRFQKLHEKITHIPTAIIAARSGKSKLIAHEVGIYDAGAVLFDGKHEGGKGAAYVIPLGV